MYDMLEFALEYHAALNTMTADRDMKLCQFELSKKEWAMASELCKALQVRPLSLHVCQLINLPYYQIFKHGTLFFSCDTPNVSTIIPAMDHIDEYLATASQNPTNSEAIHAALALGKQTLNQYYDKTDHSEVYKIAMGESHHIQFYFDSNYNSLVLHPCHKLHYFKKAGWEDDWIDTA